MQTKRQFVERDLAFDTIHHSWESFISNYDTNRRIEVLIDDFLKDFAWKEKTVLEVGTGLGFFTKAMIDRNPREFTTVDISPNLIIRIKEKYPTVNAHTADLMRLSKELNKKYDLIVCSEVIEHTPDPHAAFGQLVECLNQNGILILSTPNRRWYWLLFLAKILRLRDHYQGYENWTLPSDLVKWCHDYSLRIVRKEGVHILPWQILIKSWLRSIDSIMTNFSFGLSINLAIKARKER